MRTSEREFDVVLYGASGFTGRQTVEYFAALPADDAIRWAIAGRSRPRLERVRDEVGGAAADVDVLVAEGHDQDAIDAIVARTRVLLSTAGPFSLHGDALVDACVRFGTHHVNITGETVWVRRLVQRYHARAAATGTRIVPFCGFDSVPSDLGTLLLVRSVRQQMAVTCRQVNAYFQLRGGLNGGTLATALQQADEERRNGRGDPFLLNPPGPLSAGQVRRSRDRMLPHFSEELGTWAGPFLMGAINTRVVRRSAALYAAWGEPYGRSFAYQEHQRFDPPLAGLKAAAATAGLAAVNRAIRTSVVRPLLRRFAPQPGTGPSEASMDGGWFRCELVATTDDGRLARATLSHSGDPANRATVRFVCESALCLIQQGDQLPGGSRRGGVLTPASALGEVLATRLQGSRFRVEIISVPEVRSSTDKLGFQP